MSIQDFIAREHRADPVGFYLGGVLMFKGLFVVVAMIGLLVVAAGCTVATKTPSGWQPTVRPYVPFKGTIAPRPMNDDAGPELPAKKPTKTYIVYPMPEGRRLGYECRSLFADMSQAYQGYIIARENRDNTPDQVELALTIYHSAREQFLSAQCHMEAVL